MNFKICAIIFCVKSALAFEYCPDVQDINGIPGIENSYFKLCHASQIYTKELAPIPDSGPLKIDSHVDVINIGEIDEHHFYYSMSMQLYVKWFDSRLRIVGLNETVKNIEIVLKQTEENLVWKPNLYIYDLKHFSYKSSLSQSGIHYVSVSAKPISIANGDGNFSLTTNDQAVQVIMSDRFEVQITCGYNHSNFPFDTQHCLFRFGVQNHDRGEVDFSPIEIADWTSVQDPKYMAQATKLSFDKTISGLGRQAFDFGGKFYSYTGMSIVLSRKFEKYMWQYFGPLFIFVVMSWLSFVINHDQVPGRMGLLITLFLILINTYSSTLANAPSIKGSGILGQWMIGCQAMVFLAMLEYGFILCMIKFKSFVTVASDSSVMLGQTKSLERKKDLDRFKKLDACCLILMPILFAIFNAWFWLTVNDID